MFLAQLQFLMVLAGQLEVGKIELGLLHYCHNKSTEEWEFFSLFEDFSKGPPQRSIFQMKNPLSLLLSSTSLYSCTLKTILESSCKNESNYTHSYLSPNEGHFCLKENLEMIKNYC